jgi:hypothetical protein
MVTAHMNNRLRPKRRLSHPEAGMASADATM